jgi:hypothetical protein
LGRHRYRVTVSGGLGEIGREAFRDLGTEFDGTNTALTGELDQAALYDVLNRVLVLGLELVEISRLADDTTLTPTRPAGTDCAGPLVDFSVR